MKRRFILYRRKVGGTFYVEDTETRKQESLGTKDRAEATSLLNARNESVRQPQLNLHIAKAYLAGTDSGVSTRTWQNALDAIIETKSGSTQHRWQRAATAGLSGAKGRCQRLRADLTALQALTVSELVADPLAAHVALLRARADLAAAGLLREPGETRAHLALFGRGMARTVLGDYAAHTAPERHANLERLLEFEHEFQEAVASILNAPIAELERDRSASP